jgi:hypothetical protein
MHSIGSFRPSVSNPISTDNFRLPGNAQVKGRFSSSRLALSGDALTGPLLCLYSSMRLVRHDDDGARGSQSEPVTHGGDYLGM